MIRKGSYRMFGSFRFVFTAVACVVLLSGCASAVVGAAATAGLAAYDERGISGVAKDTTTATKIRASMFERNDTLFRDVGISVYEGRTMLTGRVDTEEMRADAVRLAWQVEDVADVINEIVVSPYPLTDVANDTWITTQLSSKITFDANVLAINYDIETVGATIYLIGIAQSQAELDRVLNHARNISYVKNVISHVRVKEATAS